MFDAIILLAIATVGVSSVATLFFVDYREKKDSWTGILEDKKTITYHYKKNTRYHYILIFRKDNGKKVKYFVDKTIYKSFKIGNRVKKEESKFPVLIELKGVE